ncbi:MAG TPA: OmpA family protein [Sulfurovum sp.]|uniref:OmpA family protein n=1 Tax=Sulfurovum sp. TaxID=1969726 RepID=UPI002F935376
MFRKDHSNAESNFWISYADLMAGLLFVFILFIGAIVSKSIILKADLHEKEVTLNELSDSLAKSKALVMEKEKVLSEDEKLLARQNARIAQDQQRLAENERMLKLRLSEIEKLNKLLLEANAKQGTLNNQIVVLQNVVDKHKDALEQNQKSIKEFEGKVLILSNELNETKETVKIKDEKLLALLNAIDEGKTKYDDLVAKLQAQKAKIKSLTGIKLQVLAALKEALGEKIDIDKKTGSLRLASNILFGSGEAILKPEAKTELKKAFEDYIGTLVTNPNIKPHLDKIIIEGHTDSVGSYIYNLNLSQKRALAVMEYLLTLDFTKKHNIQPLMIASGRAYQDAIMVDGVEDKNASRRIEIKFRLKNEDAMHEIEKVLDAQ